MRNTAIKNFDAQLANTINDALGQGVEISTVILALDKYLFSARILQDQVIKQEEAEYINNELKKYKPEEPVIVEPEFPIEGSNINANLEETTNTSDENGEIA